MRPAVLLLALIALSACTWETYQTENGLPITFIQWQFIDRVRVKAKRFELESVVETVRGGAQGDLFGDNGEPARIVQHKKEFPPVHYLEIGHEAV